jgi:hypothetical protein
MTKKPLDDGGIESCRSLARDGTIEQYKKMAEAIRPPREMIEAMRPLIEQIRKEKAANEPQAPKAATPPEPIRRPYRSVKKENARKLLNELFPNGRYPGNAKLVDEITGSISYKGLTEHDRPLKDTILRAAGRRPG